MPPSRKFYVDKGYISSQFSGILFDRGVYPGDRYTCKYANTYNEGSALKS